MKKEFRSVLGKKRFEKMKNKAIPVLCFTAAFAFVLFSCDPGNGGGGGTVTAFTAVTDISKAPTIAIMNKGLTLHGTVEPSNATNRTITWSGDDVHNGVLTATKAETYTVTATIQNGASESSPYIKDFSIEAYDTTPNDVQTNPFAGKKWKMSGVSYGYPWSGTGSFTDDTFESIVPAFEAVTRGTYTWNGTGAEWTITEHQSDGGPVVIGSKGLCILLPGGTKLLVANFTDDSMNGTFDLVEE